MSVLHRSIRTVAPPAAVARWEPWVAVAVVFCFVLIVVGALGILDNQYRSGWVTSQQVTMDKADAIHNLLFRQD